MFVNDMIELSKQGRLRFGMSRGGDALWKACLKALFKPL